MKRVNPNTKSVYKQGFEREDGLIFWGYQKDTNSDGFRGEMWITKEKFTEKKKYIKQKYENPQYRAGLMIARAKSRCSKKGKGSVTVTADQLLKKIIKGTCELTGISFDMSSPTKAKNNLYAPSLDRIDNNNPNYSPENTRVVLVAVNQTLNEHGEKAMLPILKAMVQAIEQNILSNS